VALTGQVAQIVFRSAVAIIRSSSGRVPEGRLTDRIIAIHGRGPGQSYQSYQAVARQAQRTVDAAGRAEADPTRPLSRGELPVDPSLDPAAAAYQYRTLVRVTALDHTGEVTYATDVQSDDPLSIQDISLFANKHFQAWTSTGTTGRAIAALGSRVAVAVELLSAGRSR
jgi:hypothetical protein